MSIGSTIKRLRREKEITQEQLAEYLGITSRAISQWECDRTAPDISQLPALCHIFDVSSDVLLGIDIEKNNEAIQRYLDQARDEEWQGNFEKSVEILREALCKFPRSYPIMQRLANALVCVYSRKGIKEYQEVFDLCKRILAECTDSATRYQATETLAVAYGYADKKEEMRKLAEEMPPVRYSYENFMVYHWEGKNDLIKRQDYIHFLIHEILSNISCLGGHSDDNGKMIYSVKERKELRKLELDLIEVLFPDGDYQYFAQYGEIACNLFVSDAIRNQDFESLWYWLNKGADFAIHADTYDFNAPHTSPILRGYSSGGWIMEANGNRSQSLLDWLTTDEDSKALRSDPRYDALIERLKKVAKKP